MPCLAILQCQCDFSAGNHGIIASKRCDHLSVQDNESYGNGGSGIMLHQSSDDSIVAGAWGGRFASFGAATPLLRVHVQTCGSLGRKVNSSSETHIPCRHIPFISRKHFRLSVWCLVLPPCQH